MNLRTLRYLCALAETRHFGRAAERCFVSQPTLSAQLKRLETELGVALFERQPRNVLLTPVGEQVLARARALLRQADEIVEIAGHHRDPLSGRLAIGFIPTLGPYLLPHIVAGLTGSLPAMQLFFAEYQTAALVERLIGGRLDLAVLALPYESPEAAQLEERRLFDERFVIALPPSHPMARRKRLRGEELTGEALLLLEDGHCLRDQALAVCGAAGTGRHDMAATSLETLRQMVAAGQGMTLLPELSVRRDGTDSSIAVRRFARPEPVRRIGALWRSGSVRREAIDVVCAEIESTIARVVARR